MVITITVNAIALLTPWWLDSSSSWLTRCKFWFDQSIKTFTTVELAVAGCASISFPTRNSKTDCYDSTHWMKNNWGHHQTIIERAELRISNSTRKNMYTKPITALFIPNMMDIVHLPCIPADNGIHRHGSKHLYFMFGDLQWVIPRVSTKAGATAIQNFLPPGTNGLWYRYSLYYSFPTLLCSQVWRCSCRPFWFTWETLLLNSRHEQIKVWYCTCTAGTV